MKKFLIMALLSLVFFVSYSQDKVDKVLTGVGTEVSALHTDTKDAISTLHQDASKIVETAYADGKSLASLLYDDANKIIKYATPKLEAGLVALAQTLKTTVAEVYQAMIMKQIAVAIGDLCYGIFGLIFFYISYRIIVMPEEKLLTSNLVGKNVWKPQWAIILTLTVSASIILLASFGINFKEMILGFFAPKYGAIQELVTIVNTLIK